MKLYVILAENTCALLLLLLLLLVLLPSRWGTLEWARMFWYVSSVFVTITALVMPDKLAVLFVPSAGDGSRSPRHDSVPQPHRSVSEKTALYRDIGLAAIVENGYATVVGLSHVWVCPRTLILIIYLYK